MLLKNLKGYPHTERGIFDHKTRLTAYPKGQRRNRLSVPEFEELINDNVLTFSNKG